MDSIVIRGGKPLIGEISISGSKNASLPIMVASLLTKDTLSLSNVPRLSDVQTMSQLLEQHGTTTYISDANTKDAVIHLNSNKIDNYTAHYDIVRKMRAAIWVLGPLLARFGTAKVSLPGGCAIGARQVDMHIAVMEALGAQVEICEGYICASIDGQLRGNQFTFEKISVGATINAILAAVLAEGQSQFMNCAIEPEIVDLCNCLIKMGAEIKGIGSKTLLIDGCKELFGTSYQVISDRIEAGTYMLAAAATKGRLKLRNIPYYLVENLVNKMRLAGTEIINQDDYIELSHNGIIKPVNISTEPYPGFATDLQAQFMSFMTLCRGSCIISENIFENRFMHVPELCRMGADITIAGSNAIISGVEELVGAEVMASDLRASVSLIISGLCALGETKIKRVYHLDRGYETLEQKLTACGADIRRISGDSI